MATSRKMETVFGRIERSVDNNFVDQAALRLFVEIVTAMAMETEDKCPQSYDSSVHFRFADGSVLRMDNPAQAAFAAEAMAIDPDNF